MSKSKGKGKGKGKGGSMKVLHGDFYSSNANNPTTKPCYHSHAPLKLGNDIEIYGGSCSNPLQECDIYVGLDQGAMKQHPSRFPWNEGEAFLFKITDYQAPDDADEFKNLIEWLADHLNLGLKVHVGCIGGHGRTGTVFAALVAYMGVSNDAIQYVREHYCKKAVESKAQVDFLMKHFGCSKAEPAKQHRFNAPKNIKSSGSHTGIGYGTSYMGGGNPAKPILGKSSKDLVIKKVDAESCIWRQ